MSGTQPQQTATNAATTQGTAAVASSFVGAALGIGAWVLAHYGWTVPAEIMANATIILTPLVHYAMVRLKVAGA
jgi:hypothetical protein